mgnify:CR=1 FL=1
MSFANDYVIQEKIASGAFSVVWKAIRKSDGRAVAIKEIPLHTLHLNRRMRGEMRTRVDEDEEVHILRRITHPNVVQLLDFFEVRFGWFRFLFLYCHFVLCILFHLYLNVI